MMAYIARPPEQRFHSRYLKMQNGCWEWQAGKDQKGYGVITVDGKLIKAHRLSWILHHGPIPKHDSYHGVMVCHHCDNHACVNPDHLFLGLARDNNEDKMKKGRHSCGAGDHHRSVTRPDTIMRGDRHTQAKITDVIARLIKYGTETGRELAKHFGIKESTVSNIRTGKTWRHI